MWFFNLCSIQNMNTPAMQGCQTKQGKVSRKCHKLKFSNPESMQPDGVNHWNLIFQLWLFDPIENSKLVISKVFDTEIYRLETLVSCNIVFNFELILIFTVLYFTKYPFKQNEMTFLLGLKLNWTLFSLLWTGGAMSI